MLLVFIGTHLNRLNETIKMGTHNIGFHWEITTLECHHFRLSTGIIIWAAFILSSANAFNLVISKILLFGKQLNSKELTRNVNPIIFSTVTWF